MRAAMRSNAEESAQRARVNPDRLLCGSWLANVRWRTDLPERKRRILTGLDITRHTSDRGTKHAMQWSRPGKDYGRVDQVRWRVMRNHNENMPADSAMEIQ
jgi:hypothetical protein